MKTIKNISYSSYPDSVRVLDLYLPDQQNQNVPAFIYFHGGGFEAGDKSDGEVIASYLVPHGIAVISANYRMYPEARCPEFFMDGASCVSWVMEHRSEYGLSEQIFVGGSSAGANISMMLCFDSRFLAPYHLNAGMISGFVHDAGQPTVHYNILRERGIDPKKVIVDSDSALYHIGENVPYPPMLFIWSDHDIENRPEQNVLMISTLKHFGQDPERIHSVQMHGNHCEYVLKYDEQGDSILGKNIYEFIKRYIEK